MFHAVAGTLLIYLILSISPSAMGQEMFRHSTTAKDGMPLDSSTATKNIHPTYHHIQPTTLCNGITVAPRYLIVAPPQYKDTLQPFISWKRQTGFVVEEYYTTTNHCDSIRNHLLQRFNDATLLTPAPTYILLVGDVEQIAAFAGRHYPSAQFTYHATDLYYGEYTNDYYPEAMVGRFSVENDSQLAAIIRKSIAYEKMDYPDDYLGRVLLVAGEESQSPAPVTTNGQTDYLANEIKTYDTDIDTLCFHNPGSSPHLDDITTLIRKGVGLVCYTAHGTTAGWLNPTFVCEIADTLGDTLPAIYVNNCCLSSRYNADCFGEHLLRKTHGGAVAVIGASNSSLWEEDYFWSVGAKYPFSRHPLYDAATPGAFDRLLHCHDEADEQQAHTMGQLLVAGNMAVSQFGTPYDGFYWEIYNLLGDPSLMPFIGKPKTIVLDLPDSISVNTTTLPLTGTPHAFVAATQNDTLVGCTLLDSSGHGILTLSHATHSNPLLVTATAQQHRPLTDSIHIAAPRHPQYLIDHETYNNDTLRVCLATYGSPQHHSLTLTQTPDDSASGIAIEDIVLPIDSTTLVLPITIRRNNPAAHFTAHLTLRDANGDTYLTLPICHVQDWRAPYIDSIVIFNDTDTAGQLHHNENYQADIVVVNPTDDTIHFSYAFANQSICHNEYGVSPKARQHFVFDFTTDDTAHHLHFSTTLHVNTYTQTQQHYFIVEPYTERFEHGLSSLPWDNSTSLHPWTTDDAIAHSGRYSIRSGAIGPRQRSELALTIDVAHNDTLHFWLRTSCESEYDKMQFFIDNIWQGDWSGSRAWKQLHFPISKGSHQLLWRYSKDESGDEGNDCVWIDDLSIPLAHWEYPYGDFDTTSAAIVTPNWETPVIIYPNPANHHTPICIETAEPVAITLYTVEGRTLVCEKNKTTQHTINPATIPTGIYLLCVQSSINIRTYKLIVQ